MFHMGYDVNKQIYDIETTNIKKKKKNMFE